MLRYMYFKVVFDMVSIISFSFLYKIEHCNCTYSVRQIY